jgi:hypothetical protein
LRQLLFPSLFEGPEVQRLAGPLVEEPGDVVELGLSGFADVGALGQELA